MSDALKRVLKSKGITLLFPIVAIGCAAPAAYNSKTRQVSIRPASSDLIEQGAAAFKTYKRTNPLSHNASAKAKVNRVANRLKPVVNLPGARWEFEVFEDSSANAFALPGGKVGVNTGLLRIAQTDAELAAVVAHEMAHVTSNHAQSRIQRNQTVALGGAILGAVLSGSENGQQLGQLAQKGGEIAFGLTFSRSQELEADRIGTLFMARAGYDPTAAISLWQKMGASQKSRTPELLSTHPVSATRIQKLREFMPTAQAQRR